MGLTGTADRKIRPESSGGEVLRMANLALSQDVALRVEQHEPMSLPAMAMRIGESGSRRSARSALSPRVGPGKRCGPDRFRDGPHGGSSAASIE